MKIVHSLWSKPLLKSKKNQSYGGWREIEYFFMSWALSCLTFSRFYDDVELVTDAFGFDLLINKLKLPYTKVSVVLNKLDKYSDRLWALGKIYTYQIQESPFLHVDGDVFIWEKFGANIEEADLVTQQLDYTNGHYIRALSEAQEFDLSISEIILNDVKYNENFKAFNAGIIGGKDVSFFHSFGKTSFDMINSNKSKYGEPFGDAHYALLYEQLLFSCMTREANRKVTCLIENESPKGLKFNGDVSNFRNKYNDSYKFVHILGGIKHFPSYCYELRNQMQVEFPVYLERIERIVKDDQLLIGALRYRISN